MCNHKAKLCFTFWFASVLSLVFCPLLALCGCRMLAFSATALSALWWLMGWFMDFQLLQWELERKSVIALLCLYSPPWVFYFKEAKQVHFCLRCFYCFLEIKSISTTYLSSFPQSFTWNFSKCSHKNLKIFLLKKFQGEAMVMKMIVAEMGALFSWYLRPLNYFTMTNVL